MSNQPSDRRITTKKDQILVSFFFSFVLSICMLGSYGFSWFSPLIIGGVFYTLYRFFKKFGKYFSFTSHGNSSYTNVSNASPFHESFDDMNPSCPASSRYQTWKTMHD